MSWSYFKPKCMNLLYFGGKYGGQISCLKKGKKILFCFCWRHTISFQTFQVIAFTCCFITVILMVAATSTADWMLAEGWREGLFMQCISAGADTPLPFKMDADIGCRVARSASKLFNNLELPNASRSRIKILLSFWWLKDQLLINRTEVLSLQLPGTG